ncbi:MAG: hypothetical protein DMG96_33810 [Acidobacteria bacterium]|nr:MAG: hypothetical protein DMG96_33810 [Acidobacteriota bacterium]
MADSTRKPEWTDEQATEFALFDASRDPKEFLPQIYREASNAAQDPDARISKTLAKCSALFVRLSDEQVRSARRLDLYTRWLIGLTVELLIVAAVQTYKLFCP